MRKLIKKTWFEVALLLAICGGFWNRLDPPIEITSGISIGSFGPLVMAGVLGVRALLMHSVRPALYIVKVLAFAFWIAAVYMFLTYIVDRSDLVLTCQIGGKAVELVRGTKYQPDILKVKETETISDCRLLAYAGGIQGREKVWKPESISKARQCLILGYFLSLLFTLLSIAFFIEVLRCSSASKRDR